jgi:hypothetical protein
VEVSNGAGEKLAVSLSPLPLRSSADHNAKFPWQTTSDRFIASTCGGNVGKWEYLDIGTKAEDTKTLALKQLDKKVLQQEPIAHGRGRN